MSSPKLFNSHPRRNSQIGVSTKDPFIPFGSGEESPPRRQLFSKEEKGATDEEIAYGCTIFHFKVFYSALRNKFMP